MAAHSKRDDDVYWVDGDGVEQSWFYSSQATTIKYGILFGILSLGFLIIFGSWLHARQRLRKNLPPLRYHRWLVPIHIRARYEPHLRQPEANFTFYRAADGYDMHTVAPPPVYNPNFAQPPAYPGLGSGGPPVNPPQGKAAAAGLGPDPFADGPGEGSAAAGMPAPPAPAAMAYGPPTGPPLAGAHGMPPYRPPQYY